MVDEDDLLSDAEGQDEKEKKKGDGTETGSMTRGEVELSQGFFETMARFGASKELVAEILRNWRHLSGQGLFSRLRDFAKSLLVKSSHVSVEIDRDKNYSLLHDVIRESKTPETTAQQTQSMRKPAASHNLDLDLTLKPKM